MIIMDGKDMIIMDGPLIMDGKDWLFVKHILSATI